MPGFRIDIDGSSKKEAHLPVFGDYQKPKKMSTFRKILLVSGGGLLIALIAASIFGYFYWQRLKASPQYSLALIVDAARNDNKEELSKLIETDLVINDFVSQVTEKAIELYGRNLPKELVLKASQIAAPILPRVKETAEKELPKLIREKTTQAGKYPVWMIALGADTAIEVKIDGDLANIKSKLPDKPLELTMRRDGGRWKVVAIKDEKLANRIAQSIGQKIIESISKNGLEKISKSLGIENLGDIIKEFGDFLR